MNKDSVIDFVANKIVSSIKSESSDGYMVLLTNIDHVPNSKAYLQWNPEDKSIDFTTITQRSPLDVSLIRDKVCDEIGVSKDMIEIVYG